MVPCTANLIFFSEASAIGGGLHFVDKEKDFARCALNDTSNEKNLS